MTDPVEYVWVPKVPTPAMRANFRADPEPGMAGTYYTHTTLQCADFDSRYAAMLAAAPQPSESREARLVGLLREAQSLATSHLGLLFVSDITDEREKTEAHIAAIQTELAAGDTPRQRGG